MHAKKGKRPETPSARRGIRPARGVLPYAASSASRRIMHVSGDPAPRPGPPRTRSPSRPRPNNPGAGLLGVDPEGPRLLPPPWGLGYELSSLCGLARTVQRVTRQRRGWRDQACAGARRTAFCMVPIRPCRSGDPPKQDCLYRHGCPTASVDKRRVGQGHTAGTAV